LQFGSDAVEPVGEPGQVTGRDFRKEVMLQMKNIWKEILFFTFPRRVRAILCDYETVARENCYKIAPPGDP
jgi:hypothetical protein